MDYIEVASAVALATFAGATLCLERRLARARTDPDLSVLVVEELYRKDGASRIAMSRLYLCNPGPTPVVVKEIRTSTGVSVGLLNTEARRQEDLPIDVPCVVPGYSCLHGRTLSLPTSDVDEYVVIYSTTRKRKGDKWAKARIVSFTGTA